MLSIEDLRISRSLVNKEIEALKAAKDPALPPDKIPHLQETAQHLSHAINHLSRVRCFDVVKL